MFIGLNNDGWVYYDHLQDPSIKLLSSISGYFLF
jgi:hypothetical protein